MALLLLNNGPAPEGAPREDIAARLRTSMNRLKGEFFDLERGKVEYPALRDSEAYRQYTADTALLGAFHLDRLTDRPAKLAFWINLYNTLVIHGIIELGITESVKEEPNFFRRIAYNIGGLHFTPDDIEHGILRGNRHPPYGIFHPFSGSDPRASYVLEPPDVRIHFALVCGSVSCPPIQFYAPDQIERQLELAAAAFVNGPEVEILPEENLMRLSPIFKWYRSDFGGHEGIIDTLIRYMDHGEKKDFLLERGMAAEVEWKEYDWSLNR